VCDRPCDKSSRDGGRGIQLTVCGVPRDLALATIDLNRRYVDQWLGDMRGRFFRELRGDTPVEPSGRK